MAGDGPADGEVADGEVADGRADAGVVAVAPVRVPGAEAAHPASTAAAIPPATMRPTFHIAVVLPRATGLAIVYTRQAPAWLP